MAEQNSVADQGAVPAEELERDGLAVCRELSTNHLVFTIASWHHLSVVLGIQLKENDASHLQFLGCDSEDWPVITGNTEVTGLSKSCRPLVQNRRKRQEKEMPTRRCLGHHWRVDRSFAEG
jgi:hypothetical protein